MKTPLSLLLLLLSFTQLQSQEISKAKKIENLESFAKLYGYVRYFHPSDEAASINWDKFLYYGSKEVENAANTLVLNQKLNELFNPIAPSVQIGPTASLKAFSAKNITPAHKNEMKEITWQHYGLGGQGGLYNSIRTNRSVKVLDPQRARFGVATAFVSANEHRGKKFRLKGSMKTEVETGKGQMWMRIDCEGGKMGFFDNMDNRPVTSPAWKEYTITGTVDSNAQNFVFGVFLLGEGKLWTDKFSLEVEESGIWKAITVENSSFEQSNINGWTTGSKGYNYTLVKEAGLSGEQALLIDDNSTTKMMTSIFDEKATFGMFFTKEIGHGLSCLVPMALLGTETATFPAANADKLKALQQEMDKDSPQTMRGDDLYVRLASVVMAWNAFEHFFPYKEEAQMKWDQQLSNSLEGAYETKTHQAFASVLHALIEKLKDGHARLSYGNLGYYTIEADATFAEGKIIISKVDSAINKIGQLPLSIGDEVISIDGKPAMQRLNELKKEVSGSDQYKTSIAQAVFFNGIKNTELSLKVKSPSGTEKNMVFLRENYKQARKDASIKKLNGDIYYINIGNTEMKDITAIMDDLAKAKGIVCDLRGYPRNNHALINHLLSVEDKNKWMFVPRIIHPNYHKVTYEGLGWNMKPAQPHIKAKVVFLTGGGAISYAESYMGFIKQYKLATIIGQPTAGANGNINSFNTPGGYNISFTGMKVKLQDGGQLHGIGIQPDIFVNQTIKGITEGRDEYLEKALEQLK